MKKEYYACIDGDSVQKVIEEKSGTQTAFAKKLGVAQPDISRILHGKYSISKEKLDRFNVLLGEDVTPYFERRYLGSFRSEKEREEVRAAKKKGMSCEKIAKLYGCTSQAVRNAVKDDPDIAMGPLTDEEKTRIDELYRQHVSKSEIAKDIGRALRTVHRYIDRTYGDSARDHCSAEHPFRSFKIGTAEEQNDVKRQYLSGVHTSTIAAEHGCSEQTVDRVLKGLLGNDYRTLYPRQRKRHVATRENIAEINRMRKAGAPVQTIAERFDCSVTEVYQILRKSLGDECQPRPRERRAYKATAENKRKVMDMHSDGMSAQKIAEALGCSVSTVYNIIHAGSAGA